MKQPDASTESVKNTLDQYTVDEETRRKLVEARRQALSSAEVPKSSFYRPALIVFASIAVLVVTISLVFGPEEREIAVDNIDAFEIITSQESLDMYRELEFYVWLDGQLSDEG